MSRWRAACISTSVLSSFAPCSCIPAPRQVTRGLTTCHRCLTWTTATATSNAPPTRPFHPVPPADQLCAAMEGLSAVWSAAYQPDRTLKTKFLAALLKPLDDGCCLASGGAAKVRHSYRYLHIAMCRATA